MPPWVLKGGTAAVCTCVSHCWTGIPTVNHVLLHYYIYIFIYLFPSTDCFVMWIRFYEKQILLSPSYICICTQNEMLILVRCPLFDLSLCRSWSAFFFVPNCSVDDCFMFANQKLSVLFLWVRTLVLLSPYYCEKVIIFKEICWSM